jgi:hypothetical protein
VQSNIGCQIAIELPIGLPIVHIVPLCHRASCGQCVIRGLENWIFAPIFNLVLGYQLDTGYI